MDETIKKEIIVVSLGPGDPELITLKGLRTLENSDVIFCPTTIIGERQLSRSTKIIEALGVDVSKIESYYLPMSKDRTETLEIYKQVANRCVELANKGLRVAVTAEGDGGFYSSSQYISEMIVSSGVEVRRISGVPAFIDCAALANIHIASGDKGLVVIPYLENVNKIEELLSDSVNIVLMKLSQSESNIKKTILENINNAKFHYIENRGTEKEYYSSDVEIILERKYPYFSILIIESL